VNAELLRARLTSLEVHGSMVVRATTYAAIKDRMVSWEGCTLEVVPDDARYVAGDLTLVSGVVERSGHQVGAVKAKTRGTGAMAKNRDEQKTPAAKPSAEPQQEQHRVISGAAHVKL
jgi:hypothetical protein